MYVVAAFYFRMLVCHDFGLISHVKARYPQKKILRSHLAGKALPVIQQHFIWLVSQREFFVKIDNNLQVACTLKASMYSLLSGW